MKSKKKKMSEKKPMAKPKPTKKMTEGGSK